MMEDCDTDHTHRKKREPEVTSSKPGLWYKFVKALTLTCLFFVSTTSTVLSQGSTAFLVSQISYPSYNTSRPQCPLADTGCSKFQNHNEEEMSSGAWQWCLFAALLFPDILTVIKSGFLVTSRHFHNPPARHLLVPLTFQTLHTCGIWLLFFVALPGLSATKTLVLSASVCIVPAFFKACSDANRLNGRFRHLLKLIDVLCVLLQLTSVVVWSVVSDEVKHKWALPLGLFLTSFGWWESYLPYDHASILSGFFLYLRNVRDETLHDKQQHFVNFIISAWKILISFITFFAVVAIMKPVPEIGDIFTSTKVVYKNTKVTTVTPGYPPSIRLNETFMTCGKSFTEGTIPIVSYPDSEDCSGFWTRICLLTTPSLTYRLCPENMVFAYNVVDKACFNQGICCVPFQEADCGQRTFYNCPNFPRMENFSFPNNNDTFFNWALPVMSESTAYVPLLALTIQILSTLLAYLSIKFACQTRSEILGFALPMTIAPAISIGGLLVMCNNFMTDACIYENTFPANLFFNCYKNENFWSFLSNNWLFVFTFFSQMWTSGHIWTVRSRRLAKVELLFDTPFYNSLLIEQSLLLNRRMDDVNKNSKDVVMEVLRKQTKVIGCATMWHETKEEMLSLMESVLTLDKDSHARSPWDEDNYHWEMHIFFDDAIKTDPTSGSTYINSYVKQFLQVIKEISEDPDTTGQHIRDPVVIKTPYGGQMLWTLPHGSKMTCHLKDSKKVKNKKRWSQCLYFMYFLGYPEMSFGRSIPETVRYNEEQIDSVSDYASALNSNALGHHLRKHQGGLSHEKIHTIENNSFILALDGDMKFTPDAVMRLVDLMRRDNRIGAACGRVHPVGSGLVAMYQKFEYAIGHWLQKSTEHILGNVLCSPGCFSLYRCRALLDNLTSKDLPPAISKYRSETQEPIEHLKYDHGEDRWLCTLLIERGWKVEYCAISDSYTICPETFEEFYNQRRRWIPSTVANLLELLQRWQSLLAHGSVSGLHILYQVLTFLATAIGPGSIYVLLVGGLHLTLNIPLWDSFFYNLIPTLIYVVVCLLGRPAHQVLLAKILSLVYALGMVALMFTLIVAAAESCVWAPSTLSLELTVGTFLLVGILHPSEVQYLLYGIVYYLSIPSMFMLLPFYCVFNIDDVSWGTRDTQVYKESNSRAEIVSLRNYFTTKPELKELNASIKQELSELKQTMKMLVPKERLPQEEAVTESSEEVEPYPAYWHDNMETQVKELPDAESEYLKEVVELFLKPESPESETKTRILEGLKTLKTEIFLMFLFVNAAWAFGVFLMQVSATRSKAFTIDWLPCPISSPLNSTTADPTGTVYMSLDPINLVFVVFFLSVLMFQAVGMIGHRLQTLGHTLASTDVFSRPTPLKNLDGFQARDVSVVDGRPIVGIDNPAADSVGVEEMGL